jgi:hypothetical protein
MSDSFKHFHDSLRDKSPGGRCPRMAYVLGWQMSGWQTSRWQMSYDGICPRVANVRVANNRVADVLGWQKSGWQMSGWQMS